jgi:hypothetical protein
MKREDVIKLGFKPLPHFTIMDSLIYDLGRRRQLSIGCVGTPNETMFISEIDNENPRKITDSICLHNYDYDGYLTEDKIKNLITVLNQTK